MGPAIRMKDYSTRTSFSLPPKLLRDLDQVTRTMGFGERSKAIQTAVRNLVDQSRISSDPDALATGTIVLLYDHTKRRIDEMITEAGHHFGRLVVSTLHVHLEDPNCLNVVVVRGKVRTILELEQHFRKLRGITQLKFSYVLTKPEGGNQLVEG